MGCDQDSSSSLYSAKSSMRTLGSESSTLSSSILAFVWCVMGCVTSFDIADSVEGNKRKSRLAQPSSL